MLPIVDNSLLELGIVAVLAYLLGSIPFGMVISRMMGLGDLRNIGSGNIGATNVLRTGNKGAALATLLLDGAKGAAAVLVARAAMGEDGAQVAGLFSFLGHLFPVWLGFRGGKGVATFLGVMLALVWPVGLLCCGTWALVAAGTRLSSLAALVSAATSTFWMFFLGNNRTIVLGVILTLLIYIRHWKNLERIKAGTEPRIGQKG